MDVPSDDLIVISVVAKQGNAFAGYDLLQAITATGMKFGEMNIFHYYSAYSAKPLFSLASLTEPGDFDWDLIGNFSCTGLSLFMHTSVEQPEEVFALMVATAEQLADDLDGELRGQQFLPWNEEVIEVLRSKLVFVPYD